VGDQLPGDDKWSGGVLAADGNIYGMPFNATQVLRFDPRSQQATRVGDELPGGSKWSGGVLAADGNIYGIPSFVHRAGGKHLVMHLAMHLPSSAHAPPVLRSPCRGQAPRAAAAPREPARLPPTLRPRPRPTSG
jgi:hypothetical protein